MARPKKYVVTLPTPQIGQVWQTRCGLKRAIIVRITNVTQMIVWSYSFVPWRDEPSIPDSQYVRFDDSFSYDAVHNKEGGITCWRFHSYVKPRSTDLVQCLFETPIAGIEAVVPNPMTGPTGYAFHYCIGEGRIRRANEVLEFQ